MTSTYPRPPFTRSLGIKHPRRAVDLPNLPLPPKALSSPPNLPCPTRPLEFVPGYTLTTHLVPAAYPRYSYLDPRKNDPLYSEILNDSPPPSAPKALRAAWADERTRQLRERRERMEKTRDPLAPSESLLRPDGDNGPVLWNVLNRYARVGPSRDKRDFGLTIIVCHANGMHKETWEPTIKHLIELTRKKATGICIDEVWSIDAAHTGDSALVNRGKTGDHFDWLDHVRDVLNIVENYIPDGPYNPSAPAPPTHLERVASEASARRIAKGFADRHLVGLGHSFGGLSLANAASSRPNLFLSLTLVDPVIAPQSSADLYRHVSGALLRREHWPSRAAAKEVMSKNPFWAPWDPAVLDLYVEYALTDAEGGGVTLKMNRFDEAVTFIENHVPAETWEVLPNLDEKIKLRWIMAGKPTIGTEESMQTLVWRRINNSSNVRIDRSGHLIAQIAPYELAKETLFGWRVMLAETQDPIWARLKL